MERIRVEGFLDRLSLEERLSKLKEEEELTKTLEEIEQQIRSDELSRKKARAKSVLSAMVGLFAAVLSGVATFLSVVNKDLLSNFLSNWSAIASIIGLLISLTFLVVMSAAGSVSGRKRTEYDLYEVDREAAIAKRQIERSLEHINIEQPRDASDNHATPEHYLSVVELSELARYLSGLIRYLNAQMDQAEKKASVLLVTGKMYVRRGIYFYIATIFFWQIFAALKGGLSHFMILGVVSCSLTFLVIEFLAAWFLRQYKSYVDSALLYAKIKTHFDGLMLSYLSVREFDSSGEKSLEYMADILKQPVVWPAQLDKSDINHMSQMFDSIALVAEKARRMVGAKPKIDEKE